MILTLRTLFVLLALATFINATRWNNPSNSSPTNPHGPVKDVAKQLSTLYLTDFESDIAIGANIWAKNSTNDMEAAVITLDGEIGQITRQSNDFSSAAAVLHGFLEASGEGVDKIVDSIVKAALVSHALYLLRTLQHFYIWSTPEQFHWFQALSYKSEWYDPYLWQTHPMNWSENLAAICKADNLALLNDIISENPLVTIFEADNPDLLSNPVFGILSEHPLIIETDTLFDLIVKHDSLNIYQSLTLNPHEHLKILAESGSFKILRYLYESKAIELHLEEYHLPANLPEDFKFFWMQGYRYLPASHFLSVSCEHGRVDILEFLYQLNPIIMRPELHKLNSAAKNGHSKVLEWTLSHNLPFYRLEVASELVLNGHFKIFEQLQKKINLFAGRMQSVANDAAKQNKLNAVKWVYEKFKIVPKSFCLGNADIEMLKWIESVHPQAINEELAENSNFKNLKWLSETHSGLLTDNVRNAHNYKLANFEKIQWMISQGWKVDLDMVEIIACGEIETLKFWHKDLQMKPTDCHAEFAAECNQIKVLELIYSIDPSCIVETALSCAIYHSHLEAAKYLESILNLKGKIMHTDLWEAFNSGDLEFITWVYQNYVFKKPNYNCLNNAIEKGHLHVIDWALDRGFILKTDVHYLKIATKWGQNMIFQRLIDYGMTITKIKDFISLAFGSNSLKMMKYFVEKSPESVKLLKDEEITVYNYHIVQWLRDCDFWKD